VKVAVKGQDGTLGDATVVLTKKRLLFTNDAHTRETLSIPLGNVTAPSSMALLSSGGMGSPM